ncbi:polyphosphate kinase 2 family protein [Arthrobacter sp. I2-34]|uniref:Polyphosphate kinase 2 family protein n=1 Tax=Arthrobacter hankyongi TaxID=2904801 RepID=A0ABS9L4Z4_9MICC|nr:PPK2 family polyphosphate kinase [Arthrobacter hankyongi]MCG2621752.1 polyphosphate kinase 2 family protein [Arthrobacter hankyongi]
MTDIGLAERPHEILRVGQGFDLAAVDPDSTPGFDGAKEDGSRLLAEYDQHLSDLQERLFAASRAGAQDALLLVLQGMDTAGKGGIVRHVIGVVDPQGVQHHAFKQPAGEEVMHDFLWRVAAHLPGYGMIGCFDRSHYEDVLIHRVRKLSPVAEIEARYDLINGFEYRLAGGGMRIVKVMLHISREEGKARLQERLDRPDKHWKYNPGDVDERQFWDQYMQAYQIALERTSTAYAPWYVVPANKKWYARLAVQQLLLNALQQIDPQWPVPLFDVEVEKKRLAGS